MTRRRTVLSTVGTGALGGLAGCTDAVDKLLGRGSAAVAAAQAWPTTRGPPQATGRSSSGGPGVDAEQVAEVEFRNGILPGLSAPIVGTDAVYEVTRRSDPYDHDPPTDRVYAHAHSRDDGSERWRRTVFEVEGQEAMLDGLREVYSGLGPDYLYAIRIYVEDDAMFSEISALSRNDGSTDWSVTLEARISTQPVVHDGTVYLFASDELVALDAASGDERWRQRLQWDQFRPTVGDGAVAVHNRGLGDDESDWQLTVFDADDGSERWTEPIAFARNPTPTIADGAVYVTDGGPYGQTGLGIEDRPDRKVYAFDLSDGSERWAHVYDREGTRHEFAGGGTGSVTVAGDHVYYALGFPNEESILGQDASPAQLERVREDLYRDPNVFALDREDGSVVWETQVGELAQTFRPMAADDDFLYVPYGLETPEIHVIDRESGDVVDAFGPIENDRPFAVTDGDLYVHHDDHVRIWR